jgi:hypothetical protein
MKEVLQKGEGDKKPKKKGMFGKMFGSSSKK